MYSSDVYVQLWHVCAALTCLCSSDMFLQLLVVRAALTCLCSDMFVQL